MKDNCRRYTKRAPIPGESPGVEDVTYKRMVKDVFDSLEFDIRKRILLADTFDTPDKFQDMICHICCNNDLWEPFEGIYDRDDMRFIEKCLHSNHEREKELIERAMLMASLYMALVVLLKLKVNKKRRYEL
ncbi:hypothetical protein MCP_2356 [Methanocella paludicola SANAE]|uniref:Uncharacterized protein n=1 Tax=Methanocella paludicola (strain DSM 17711 / JCM 13418 / NBRC 101707 / SANAE) TaxID=304371 RepID=D1Z156_METPS|nr:hypothetical protein [Methanocella paludicola]BAI62428.1 hypothetical protein MCP_2356 [Methanocella paludicola SANAE]